MARYLHLICDYSPGDMAWSEVFSAFSIILPEDVRMHMSSVASFDTVATGFVVGQLALADPQVRPSNMLIFANCAPRKDIKQARQKNEGEGLLFAALNNEVQVLAVNSGHSLSFIRSEIRNLWSTQLEGDGSQFRSRDFFPKIVGQALRNDRSFVLHKLDDLSIIPEEPQEAIAYIDSFGNIKTTFRTGDQKVAQLGPGDRLKVIIGSTIRTATVATGSFNVMEGDLAFAPGSSGHERRYWELFQRGGSAWREFGKPSTGTRVYIEIA